MTTCVFAQDAKAAAEQQRAQIEAEVKTLKENAALDFERIGLLSEENASLQVLNLQNVPKSTCVTMEWKCLEQSNSV